MKTFIFVALAATCMAPSALAADLSPLESAPRESSSFIAVAPPEWTGFYFGAHLGLVWGDQTWHGHGGIIEEIGELRLEFDRRGAIGGGVQIGYNYEVRVSQIGSVVIGVQGDVTGVDLNGDNICNRLILGDLARCSSKTNWLASATVRGGVASELLFFYAKGGFAVAGVDYKFEPGKDFIGSGFPEFSASETRVGWTIGAGIEYRLTQNWSGFIEYDFYDFGTSDVESFEIRDRTHIFKGGINYRFRGLGGAPTPVAARY